MYSKKVIIISEAGLYGKAAASMIQLANNYKSTIFVEYEERLVPEFGPHKLGNH